MKKLSLLLLMSFPFKSFGMCHPSVRMTVSEPESTPVRERPELAAPDTITLSDPKFNIDMTKELFRVAACYCNPSVAHNWIPHYAVESYLKNNNADANAKNSKGTTILELAVSQEAPNVALGLTKLLLKHGAKPTRDALRNTLTRFYAVNGNTEEIFEKLVNNGADVNAQDPKTGDTLLHENLEKVPAPHKTAQLKALALLTKHNANIKVPNFAGVTPQEIAHTLDIPLTSPSDMSDAIRKNSDLAFKYSWDL